MTCLNMKLWAKYFVNLCMLAALIVIPAGCNSDTMDESRVKAHERWAQSRSKLVYEVGLDNYRTGQLDEAVQRTEEAASLDPENPIIRHTLAKIYIERGQYSAAEEQLDWLVERQPDSAEIHYLLGVTLEKMHRFDEALDHYRRSHALDDSSLAAVEAGVEVLIQMNRHDEAQKYLDRHMTRRNADAGTYELAGRLALMQDNPRRAAAMFQRACDNDHRNVRYPEMLASAHAQLGEYERAAEVLQRLATREEYEAPARVYTMLGDCWMALNNPRRAMAAYSVAARLDNEDAQKWLDVARAALASESTTRAFQSVYEARRLDPDNREITLMLGYLALTHGDGNQAIEILEQANRIHSDDVDLLNMLGRAYHRDGQYDRARQTYERALAVDADHRVTRHLLAHLQEEAHAVR